MLWTGPITPGDARTTEASSPSGPRVKWPTRNGRGIEINRYLREKGFSRTSGHHQLQSQATLLETNEGLFTVFQIKITGRVTDSP